MDEKNKVLFNCGIAIIVVLATIATVCYLFNIDIMNYTKPCILRERSGFYCPGCGGTRAVIAMLAGHFVESLFYHPAVLYLTVIYIIFMASNSIQIISKNRIKVGMKYRRIYVIIAFAILIINCIIKNAVLIIYGIHLV